MMDIILHIIDIALVILWLIALISIIILSKRVNKILINSQRQSFNQYYLFLTQAKTAEHTDNKEEVLQNYYSAFLYWRCVDDLDVHQTLYKHKQVKELREKITKLGGDIPD